LLVALLAPVLPLKNFRIRIGKEDTSVHKSVKTTKNSRKRSGRLSLASAVVAIAVLAAGAVTVVSKHRVVNDQAQMSTKASQRVETLSARRFSLAGQNVQAQDLTPVEADRLASGLGEMIDPSADGLTQVRHPDGSVSMDLNGHFQNVTVGKVERNGNVSQSCVNNPESAGAFFGINPNRITNQSPKARLPR
jgi:hypothetical protein